MPEHRESCRSGSQRYAQGGATFAHELLFVCACHAALRSAPAWPVVIGEMSRRLARTRVDRGLTSAIGDSSLPWLGKCSHAAAPRERREPRTQVLSATAGTSPGSEGGRRRTVGHGECRPVAPSRVDGGRIRRAERSTSGSRSRSMWSRTRNAASAFSGRVVGLNRYRVIGLAGRTVRAQLLDLGRFGYSCPVGSSCVARAALPAGAPALRRL